MATSRLQLEGDDSVHLHITHANLKSFSADARFSPQVSLVLHSVLIPTVFQCSAIYKGFFV